MANYSETTAWLMWILGIFGCCGLHRCYLGKVGTGFLWFITEGLCWVGQIVDAFQLSEMVKEANGHKHSHTVTVVVTNTTYPPHYPAQPYNQYQYMNSQPIYTPVPSSYAPPYPPPSYNQYPPYQPPATVHMRQS